MIKLPEPAKRPTMYFVGVTTGQSSIMKMFPIWAKELGLDAEIKGIDLPIHAPAEDYRAVVQFFRDDPLSLGALVTTHKIDMYNAAKDMFDYLDPYAQRFGELSSISKLDGQLRAHAKDPISSGLALDAFVPEGLRPARRCASSAPAAPPCPSPPTWAMRSGTARICPAAST